MQLFVNEFIRIRTVLPSDWEDIVRLVEDNIENEQQAALDRLQAAPPQDLLILELENQLTGLAHLAQASSSLLPEENLLYIENFILAKNHLGEGLGTLLLAAVKETVTRRNQAGFALKAPETDIDFYRFNGCRFWDGGEAYLADEDVYLMIWRKENEN